VKSRLGRSEDRQTFTGGSIHAGLTIYDTMQFVRPDVMTMCVGSAMGMGALIVLGGTSGKRFALPHAKILHHQVSAGFEGTSSTTRGVSCGNGLPIGD